MKSGALVKLLNYRLYHMANPFPIIDSTTCISFYLESAMNAPSSSSICLAVDFGAGSGRVMAGGELARIRFRNTWDWRRADFNSL